MKGALEKLGSSGAVVAAAACPVCFPKLALIGALMGLGGLAAYESQLFIAAQALVVVALAGHILSFRRHRRRWILAAAAVSALAVFAGRSCAIAWNGPGLPVEASGGWKACRRPS